MYRHASLFSYARRYGVQFRGDDTRPGESRSGHGAVACPVLKQGRLRGWRRSGWPWCVPAGPRELLTVVRTGYSGRRGGVPSPRAQQRQSSCSSARRGAAGAGMAAQDWQRRGWRSHQPDVTVWPCRVTRRGLEGAAGPPSGAWRVSRTKASGTRPRSWHRPRRTVPHSGGDGFPLGTWRNSVGAWFPGAWWRGSAVSEH
jgi:hypothetical protein